MEHRHSRPERPADWPPASKTPAQFEFDLLAAMAEDPSSGLVPVAPGFYKAAAAGCPFCASQHPSGGWISGPC